MLRCAGSSRAPVSPRSDRESTPAVPASFVCNKCTVTGNGSHGINAEESSVATVYNGATVTGNVGAGVNLTNLSSATFDGSGTVSNNNSGLGDIVCNPNYTAAAGLPGTVGKVVNCP